MDGNLDFGNKTERESNWWHNIPRAGPGWPEKQQLQEKTLLWSSFLKAQHQQKTKLLTNEYFPKAQQLGHIGEQKCS